MNIFKKSLLSYLLLQARGKKRQKGWFPASNVQVLGSNSGKSTPAPQPGNNAHTHVQTKIHMNQQCGKIIVFIRNIHIPTYKRTLFLFSVSLSGDRHIRLHSRQRGRDELLQRTADQRPGQERS